MLADLLLCILYWVLATGAILKSMEATERRVSVSPRETWSMESVDAARWTIHLIVSRPSN